MSGHGVMRATYLVFGAREVDEPDEGAEGVTRFCQFEKDWDAQLAQCARLAAERGYRPAGSDVCSVWQPTQEGLLAWASEPGCEVMVVASERILERFRGSWPDWDQVVQRLADAGARIEAAPYPEPAYPGEDLPQR